MKLSKFTVILVILLVSILAMGAVSAETVDDSDIVAVTDGDLLESVDITDAADDLSSADNADETVSDDSSAVLGDTTNSYDLDDDSYSTYFNEDGTAKETLSADGDYSLNIGTLTNKDIKIISGSNINITAKEGAGFINNGTIYLDGGYDGLVGSVTISGLTFSNTNKGAIDIAEMCTNINIIGNTMNMVGDTSLDSSIYTLTTIFPHNYIYGLNIINNKIRVTGDIPYSNGIYAMNWGCVDAPSNFNISGNTFDLDITATTGSAAAVYVECSDSVIENNYINVKTVGSEFAYGIQVPDSSYSMIGYGSDPTSNSPKNILINNNHVNIETEYMAYGITVLSFGYDIDEEELYSFPICAVISNNNIYIKSDKGVFGLGGIFYDEEISNNNLTIIGGSSEGTASADMLGVGTVAIKVTSRADYAEFDVELNVINNNIFTNVTDIFINDYSYVNVEDNNIFRIQDDEGNFIVSEETFDIFFDENGDLKGIIPEGSTILLDELSNKKLNIDIPLTIKSIDEYSVSYNTVINLVEGADGTVIDGVNIDFTGDENTGSIGIIYAKEVENIVIKNNKINVWDFVDKTGDKYGSSVYAIELESGTTGCNNVLITGNEIYISGSARYLYGIDVFQTWGSENKNTNLNISNNKVDVYGGSRMAEPIYVSGSSDVLIANNTVSSESEASAYGIATDSLTHAIISENEIEASSDAMAYAITATNGNNLTFEKNDIISSGAGAVGIGLMNDDTVTINSNTIKINGGDYITASTGDSLGTANAAILDKSGNSNLNIGENDITENLPIIINNENYGTYFNEDGTIKEDSPIESDSHIVLDKLTNKSLIIDVPVYIEGTCIDSKIILISGAEGTTIASLDMEATVTSGSLALIDVQEVSDIKILENNLVIICSNDLSSWDMIMPIEIEGGSGGCSEIRISGNNITVTGSAPYVYGIDAFKHWKSENKLSDISIYYNNIKLNVNSSMTEGIYLSGAKDSYVSENTIEVSSDNSAYGIGTDGLDNTEISYNKITANAGTMAYGITATVSGENLTISENKMDITGTGAIGVGLSGQTNPTVSENDISIDGGDYTTLEPKDTLGTANAAILDKSGNTNVKIEGNTIDEYTDIKLEFVDLTVTAAPSGQGAFEVTVKTIDGNVLANKEITFSFNNKVFKATTDANGIAKLSFDLNNAGKYPVSIAFLGDKQYKGAFTTATITINPIKTSLASAAKTYLATASSKTLTATLKDADGKVLANKKVTFTVNGKTYSATTNAKGVATVKLALTAAKTYTVSIKFAGDNVYAASTVSAKVKLNKEKTKVTAPKKTFKRSAKTKKVVITLKNSKGKAIAKKKITLTVNKKKYTAKTNKKGKATIKVKLTKKGTFKYKVKFAGDTQYKAAKKNGKIKIK